LVVADEVVQPISLEHAVLQLLDQGNGPAGSGTLMDALHDRGFTLSEPTVGRFLRRLDRLGYTERVSNLGRTLTDVGRARLAELCAADARGQRAQELMRSLRATTPEEVLDVLVARRALEREIGRLAAVHASEQDVAELEAAIASQRQHLAHRGIAIEDDIHFHRLLAAAARNRLLAAALELIRGDEAIALAIDRILKKTSRRYVVGHERILDAVRRHAPDEAEAAMLDHVDAIIADVRAFQSAESRG
jgi:GntR family L-lactate dehydrogenase operon transcriptional regulator